MVPEASGWAVLLLAGSANATFGLPLKFVRHWEWENTWTAWSVLALLLLPAALALGGVPSLTAIYSGSGWPAVALVFIFGMGWGLAQVLFGKAIDSIGIGLAFPSSSVFQPRAEQFSRFCACRPTPALPLPAFAFFWDWCSSHPGSRHAPLLGSVAKPLGSRRLLFHVPSWRAWSRLS